MMKLAMVVAQFNPKVTKGLKKGALQFLNEKGVDRKQIEIFEAPGAFEIPLIAQTLARSKKFEGIICLGAVIKGDTAHFEFISLGAVMGIQQASLETEVPITFGILTTYSDEQAQLRSSDDEHNKGREAAAACLDAVETLKLIRLHSW
jgi:6,7-dimethyl-8-ribityllumazine synthase